MVYYLIFDGADYTNISIEYLRDALENRTSTPTNSKKWLLGKIKNKDVEFGEGHDNFTILGYGKKAFEWHDLIINDMERRIIEQARRKGLNAFQIYQIVSEDESFSVHGRLIKIKEQYEIK